MANRWRDDKKPWPKSLAIFGSIIIITIIIIITNIMAIEYTYNGYKYNANGLSLYLLSKLYYWN